MRVSTLEKGGCNFQTPRTSLYCCVSEPANLSTLPFASTNAVAQLLTQKRCALH
jgi:hypothetical protein